MIFDTKEQPVSIEDITGLICIDCWENSDLKDFYQNIERYLQFSRLQSIIVSNYELSLDSRDLCQFNTLEVYSWTHYKPDMLLPVMKEARTKQTSTLLQTHFNTHSFLLLDINSVVYHIQNAVPHINNWLIMGGAWQHCTHNRPVGFNSLRTLPYNFFIATWSIYNTNNHAIDRYDLARDRLNWTDQGNGLYQLCAN